jgi:adenylate cyclase
VQEEPSGKAPQSGADLYEAHSRRLTRAAILANGLGAIDVFLFLAFLVPVSVDSDETGTLIVRNAVASAVYLGVSLPLGVAWARRRAAPLRNWLRSGGPPAEAVREMALRQPLDFALVSAALWWFGAVVFAALNAPTSAVVAVAVGVTIALGGLTTAAVGYLLAERISRPVAARALASGAPSRPIVPGVTTRLTMAWTLATGIPVLGVAGVAVAEIAGNDVSRTTAAAATLFLAGLALAVGLLAIVVAARSVADPIAAVGSALQQVEEGDFDARVRVDDGSEVGLLESGFNRMAAGLGERERLRDLFGRHVGRDVAHAALDGEVALGGEEREIAALFVDVVGSTALAAERPPAEVVALLNAFFRIVVETVEEHEGLVNKFEGDAALCVFGAPVAAPDPAGDALAAARTLRERLRRELPEIDVGIGVSAGRAVAGNVGAEQRFEYTVIGDPVNEAARLCELAKRQPERLLASDAAVALAGAEEAAHWSVGEQVTLRGRGSPTRLATVAA